MTKCNRYTHVFNCPKLDEWRSRNFDITITMGNLLFPTDWGWHLQEGNLAPLETYIVVAPHMWMPSRWSIA